MIPNIVRGDRMGGLMAYLVGPGRANEHTEPHLVAGDPAMMAWHDDNELGHHSALAIARHLDRPRKAFGVEVQGGHVWHCSLSLRAEEGQLDDDKWRAIAEDFIRAMEFDDQGGTRAPCRWVAVRHGVSTNGNDHIHIAVNLVREDGTKATTWNDFKRAQAASRAIEAKHGLEPLESAEAQRATRGYNPAEREAQARGKARAKYERDRATDGRQLAPWHALPAGERDAKMREQLRVDQPRYLLALRVRGCAAAASDEAEFVRRMRRAGLLVRARFADGRGDVVTGYSVAARPEHGERPIWYGGGHLGRDLSLPRLRKDWPDSPEGANAAAAEWAAARRGRRPVAPGLEARDPDPQTWQKMAEDVSAAVERLRQVPLDDRGTWATVARQTAGVLAAWSTATEDEPGDLAAAAHALSKSAQTYQPTTPPAKAGTAALSGTAMLLASAARGGRGTVGQAVVIRQLLRLTQAVYEANVAAGQARHARELAEDTRARLVSVRRALPEPQLAAVGASTSTAAAPAPALDPEAAAILTRLRAGQGADLELGSPVPDPIAKPSQPTAPRSTTHRGPTR